VRKRAPRSGEAHEEREYSRGQSAKRGLAHWRQSSQPPNRATPAERLAPPCMPVLRCAGQESGASSDTMIQ
jgi:hypothetical protein